MTETTLNTIGPDPAETPLPAAPEAPVAGAQFLEQIDQIQFGGEFTTVEINGQPMRVFLAELPGDEIDDYINRLQRARDKKSGDVNVKGLRVDLVARCWVDPDTGRQVFNANTMHKLGRKLPNRVLEHLFRKAQDVNGIDKQALEKGKDDSGATGD